MSALELHRKDDSVAGVDGFQDGWFVVLWNLGTGVFRHRRVQDAEALVALDEAPAILGVDMPVGLPDRAVPGGRRCDREARRLLRASRASSVFSPPAYGALKANSYEEAQQRNRASGPSAPGLPKQTYHLFPKLRALAQQMTPARQERVREVHPELSFYAMNENAPVAESKHTAEGRARRTELLGRNGLSKAGNAVATLPDGSLEADDVLDAYAACWTARRISEGAAERCPPTDDAAPRNDRGLRMEIWR